MGFVDWSKLAKIVGAIVFVAVGYLTYGDSLLFEKIYIALLVFVGVLFFRDINVMSIVIISAIANFSSEMLYSLILGADFQTLLKILTYSALGLTLYKIKTEDYRKHIAVILGLCIVAELYWLATNYAAPNIYWYALLININLLVRYFLLSRVFIISKYFPNQYRSLDLDISLHNLVLYYIIVHCVVILEYFSRRIFNIPIDTIYYAAPYIFHGLTTYSALLIITQSYKIVRHEWFRA